MRKVEPATASLVIRDGIDRIYPNPSKRLAPDLFFQPQIYRADGDKVVLPPGKFKVDVLDGTGIHSPNEGFDRTGLRRCGNLLAPCSAGLTPQS